MMKESIIWRLLLIVCHLGGWQTPEMLWNRPTPPPSHKKSLPKYQRECCRLPKQATVMVLIDRAFTTIQSHPNLVIPWKINNYPVLHKICVVLKRQKLHLNQPPPPPTVPSHISYYLMLTYIYLCQSSMSTWYLSSLSLQTIN